METTDKRRILYIFLIPAACFVLVFNYLPLIGLGMAFVDYNMFAGSGPLSAIFSSEFVGLENFINLFNDPYFWKVFFNTLQISILKILFIFPIPILVAILLNEIIFQKFKKIVQTIIYMPHFLSWVIVAGIFTTLLGTYGLVNNLLVDWGVVSEPIAFLKSPHLFVGVILVTDAWKEVGWSTIIYLAAITGIDYQLYEAIRIDGGNKWREIKDVTVPCLIPTIVMMFILRVAGIMDAGFDQIFNMYSPFVYETADIIGTYSYRTAMGAAPDYSKATAIGLFNSIIAFTLMVTANRLARKVTGKSVW